MKWRTSVGNSRKNHAIGTLGLKWLLTLVFGMVAVGVTFLFYLVISLSFSTQFGSYLETRMSDRISETIAQIEETWDDDAGYDLPLLTDVLRRAAANGITTVVRDPAGNPVLAGPSAIRGREGRHLRNLFPPAAGRETASSDAGQPATGDEPGNDDLHDALRPNDLTRTVQLVHDGKSIGSAVVSAPGSVLEVQDEAFLSAVQRVIILTGAVLLLLGLGAAYLAASRIGLVFGHMTRAAEKIGAGRYGETVTERTRIAEIQSLMDSINRLSLALEQQESLRKRLFSDVAHDLRTPVTILLSHLEAIRDGIWEADAERMAVCMEEANQLARLIAEVEKLARLDVGETILQPIAGDLLPSVLHAIAAWEPVFAGKQVKLVHRGASARGLIEPESLVTILNNLLGNALRHTPSEGTVTVETAEMQDCVRLTVSDTGIGIPPADLPHVFERFYRADNSRNSGTGGSGIGLAIVRALVQAQGGTVRVESQLGKGATFLVEFPKPEQGPMFATDKNNDTRKSQEREHTK